METLCLYVKHSNTGHTENPITYIPKHNETCEELLKRIFKSEEEQGREIIDPLSVRISIGVFTGPLIM